MAVVVSSKAWGGAKVGSDGKVKVWRRAKDTSQQIQWRKSKKQTVISRKAAAKLSRP